MLWCLGCNDVDDGEHIVICVDSLYAINEAEGHWRANCNGPQVERCRALLKRARARFAGVTFVHVAGHSGDSGNDRADQLVQWGKSSGPYSRMRPEGGDGGGEGDGRMQQLTGYVKKGQNGDRTLFLGRTESEDDDAKLQELAELLRFSDDDGSQASDSWLGGEESAVEPLDSGWRDVDLDDAVSDSEDDTGTILRALLSDNEGGRSTDEPTEECLDEEPSMEALAAQINRLEIHECLASSERV